MGSRIWFAAAALWGFAEATLFFIVPDVILSAIGLKRGARAAAAGSVCAALGAGLGGAAMFLWSAHDPTAARQAVLAVPAVSEAMAQAAWAAMDANGWVSATLSGPLSRTPFKVYAVLAPQAGANVFAFAAASVLLRLPRFLIVGVGAALLRRWFGKRLTLSWLAAAWVVFYIGFFALTPG